MASVNDIRRAFLDFFKSNGHEVVPSSPLVPRNDPTLMFTNAGMVQFKNVFTGQETRPYVRAASSQKCVRAGGKHNDLDNVGYTARHHTFFEMLGNFSFGDYFKSQAIPLAWELLTKDFGLDKKRLTITVYHDDEEAYSIWKKLTGFSDDKIIRIATSDNFWQMGDTGPCGPCSEIFWDHGDTIPGGPPGSKDADGDRFVEIWNLVFMQYEQLPGGERIDLPKHSVDTGMGLERIAAVLQGVHDNYDIDLFKALIAASVAATGVPATGEHKASHRVIADHLRATSFLIADGVLPSNEGRGYVLRRIMRRAMRHAHLLGAKEPLMHRLVPALVHEMGDTYHELQRAQPLITETLLLEETRFKKTLEKGLGLLGEATAKLKKGDVLPGETAFKLYDTFGFPLDLTEDALRPRGISVGTEAFNAAMERQKAEARKAWKGSGEAATEAIWFEVKEKTGASEFLGYEAETAAGEIVALIKDGKEVKSLKAGEEAAIVVNQTPFYGESGGQVGDTGVIVGAKGALFRVTDTQKKAGGLYVHLGTVEKGSFKTGETVDLTVDHANRTAIRANHSATHLLHEALRQVLGPHVAQKGSLVAPGRLRFDFSHPKPMSPEEIAAVEARANAIVLQNSPVETRLMALEDAMQSGAMALFGEKYGDEVRVVSMGEAGPNANKAWSVELCGGTHVRRTGDIGLVKIIAESASASGVRRIEALTAEAARAYLSEQEARIKDIASALHVRPEDAGERVKALIEERKQLERQLAEAKKQLALGGGSKDAGPAVIEVGGRKFLKLSVSGVEMKDLKAMADDGRAKIGSGIVAIANNSADGKLGIVVAVTTDLADKVSAVDLVRAGSEAVGGKGGGGRPDMAQAGGPDGSRADAALQAIEARLNAA
ncbi:MAG: alanine--tRNA ligase [Hyphomicrobium sp.]|uniref:alanine--tRNA ligase n=1 Tax=Hyphomicrobium sp. TaxID=82 RepID=UPI001321AA52|nr:alanine--tRNA ligase [Hyphomicrobium sp.]KAB2938258.1 MAG: alanine--tRNA ligase [Hyphomicrobium sp.]MBZ0211817.1 alanine--tRNA ligase [Hyphomicrobium sp.]